MKLTRFTDYSLRVLIYLGLSEEQRVTIREVSDAYDISRNHLMKVVSNLTRLGYIEARRGPGGGLLLARPPEEINVARVITDIEEDTNLVECFCENGCCTIKSVCKLRDALQAALNAFLDELESYTLADLLEPRQGLTRLLDLKHVA